MGRSPRDRKIEVSSLKAHSGPGKLYSKGRISVLLGVPVPSDLGDYTQPEHSVSICVLLDCLISPAISWKLIGLAPTLIFRIPGTAP